jgi:hypothetical protein
MYPSLFQGPTKCSGEQVKVVKIWGFPDGNYDDCRLLGCDAVWLF